MAEQTEEITLADCANEHQRRHQLIHIATIGFFLLGKKIGNASYTVYCIAMQTFTPQKPYTYQHLIRDAMFFIGLACIYFIVYLWRPEWLSPYSWLTPAIIFVMHMLDNITRNRLHQIIYDTTSKQVIIHYKSVFSEIKEKRIPFELAKVSVYERSGKPTLMYLFKEKREVFEIRKKKDGTSTDTMRSIAQAAEEIGIRVVRR